MVAVLLLLNNETTHVLALHLHFTYTVHHSDHFVSFSLCLPGGHVSTTTPYRSKRQNNERPGKQRAARKTKSQCETGVIVVGRLWPSMIQSRKRSSSMKD